MSLLHGERDAAKLHCLGHSRHHACMPAHLQEAFNINTLSRSCAQYSLQVPKSWHQGAGRASSTCNPIKQTRCAQTTPDNQLEEEADSLHKGLSDWPPRCKHATQLHPSWAPVRPQRLAASSCSQSHTTCLQLLQEPGLMTPQPWSTAEWTTSSRCREQKQSHHSNETPQSRGCQKGRPNHKWYALFSVGSAPAAVGAAAAPAVIGRASQQAAPPAEL